MISKFAPIYIMFLSSCASSHSEFPEALQKYDAAIVEKKETIEHDGPRSVSRLFFRTLDIVKNKNLSDDEKSYFVTKSLKHYEDVYGDEGAWTGEHSESGSDYLNELCLVLGDHKLSQVLARPDFNKVLKMFKARPPVSIENFKLTQQLLNRQKAAIVPLFDYK